MPVADALAKKPAANGSGESGIAFKSSKEITGASFART